MLILTRTSGQSVHLIEAGVVVTVDRVRQGQVRLGFTAPDELTIVREELIEGKTEAGKRSLAARIRKEGKCRA